MTQKRQPEPHDPELIPNKDSPFLPVLHEDLVPSILVVDDDPIFRNLLVRTLSQFPCRIIEAENGLEALTLFETQRDNIALVLTDLEMPEMNGEKLVRALRKRGASTPIIGMSGNTDQETATRMVNAGATLFLPKTLLTEIVVNLALKLHAHSVL